MEQVQRLPPHPGAYVLVLYLSRKRTVSVGRLGRFSFPQGAYVYLGQAGGSGGLRARLLRHVRGPSVLRWHIDFLRTWAEPVAVGWRLGPVGPEGPWECVWSRRLIALDGVWVPVPGFGASDCRRGCPAHLLGLPRWPVEPSLEDVLGLTGFVLAERAERR